MFPETCSVRHVNYKLKFCFVFGGGGKGVGPFDTDRMLLGTSLPVARLARRVEHAYLDSVSAKAEKLSERK